MSAVVELVVLSIRKSFESFERDLSGKITVVILSFSDDFDDLVQFVEDSFILVDGIHIHGGLHPFVKIPVVPKHPFVRALFKTGRDFEVVVCMPSIAF